MWHINCHSDQHDIKTISTDPNTSIPMSNKTISTDPNTSIPMSSITHPISEISYTGERNVEEPLTNQTDVCEVDYHQGAGVTVNPTFESFPTRRAQNESNSNETQHVELKSEDCMEPLQCAEDMLPEIREGPVGEEDT